MVERVLPFLARAARLALAGAALGLTALAPLAAGPVHDELLAEFTRHPHRLPGSPEFTACLEKLEAVLRREGLSPRRQTFNTILPEPLVCRLTVEGREVGPLRPLAPNGAALVTTGGRALEGPIVYAGRGEASELRGRPVEGAIVLVDLATRRMPDLFSMGAKAVILVGDPEAPEAFGATRWTLWPQFTEMPAEQPRFFLERAAAEAAGLLRPEARPQGSVLAASVWKDAVATNLWLELPGEPGAVFALGREEVLVLQATLDTFGAVPGLNPQWREAANAALLAEVAVELARQPRRRPVVVLFTGSYYQQQEGGRYFYYAVGKAERDAFNFDPIEERDAATVAELRTLSARIGLLDTDGFLAGDHPELFTVAQALRRLADKKVNDANFELRALNRRLAAAASPELEARRAALSADKSAWNALRPQLTERRVAAESRPLFERLVAEYRAELDGQRRWLETLRGHLVTWAEIAARFRGRTVTGHYGFDFSGDRAPWFFDPLGDDDELLRAPTFVGRYAKNLGALAAVYRRSAPPGREAAPLYEPAVAGTLDPGSLSLPVRRVLASTPATEVGINAYQLVTVGASLALDDLPLRAPHTLAGLAPQLTAFFSELSRAPEISMRSAANRERFDTNLTALKRGNTLLGYRLVSLAPGTTSIEGPLAGAVVVLAGPTENYEKIPGIGRLAMSRTDAEGALFSPHIRKHTGTRPVNHNGYLHDATGRIVAVGYDRYQIHDQTWRAWGGSFYLPYLPDSYEQALKPLILGGRNNAAFSQERVWSGDNQVVFYVGEQRPVKFAVGGSLLLNASPAQPAGIGFPLEGGELYRLDALRQAAGDYHTLNQARLATLRERHYFNEAVERLHAGAERHLAGAAEARRENDHEKARAHETLALGLGQRAYEPLRGVVADMVVAVLVLLLLSVPFAFFLERLLLGSATIYRQLAGFCGFFLLTFLALYFTHPAFALAEAPVIIFLSFVILGLSATVMLLVLSRFKHELLALQGMASRAHDGARSGGTALAAIAIGVAGLRNRPLKTALTCLTLVLLTFTILVFSSFSGELGVVSEHLGPGGGPERIEVQRANLLPVPETLADGLRAVYQDRYDVATRAAVFDDPTPPAGMRREQLLYHPGNRRVVRLQALLGLEPLEAERLPDLGRVLPPEWLSSAPGEPPPLSLPREVAEKLDARPGDDLLLRGERFRLAGVFDPVAFSRLSNLDQTRLVPPDFAQSLPAQSLRPNERAALLASLGAGSFVYADAAQVGVTTPAALRPLALMNGVVNGLRLYPKSPGLDLRGDAAEIARVFRGPVFSQGPEGSHRALFTTALRGSGFRRILVPLALGGLIIFASLLGSIVDRQREIMTYSALGLSPRDVGTLFFAESTVYAVVGGLGGYLLGQAVSSLMAWASRLWGVEPLPINFSSLSSIVALLLVMGVVFLSTVYPARKAGKLANPGVARRWKMPKPKGDRLEFVFPFTVSARDFGGILAFLREHFDHHRDASLGDFAARDTRVLADERGAAGLVSQVSLAPFDLGVFQAFKLASRPSDIAGIDEVVVEIERVSGPPETWRRGNRRFIAGLREQFLLWRSLPAETMEHYRAQARPAA